MISVTEAKGLVLTHTVPLEAIVLPIANASGYILSEDILAEYDIPAFIQSSMDGYAISYAEDSKEFQLVGEMAAGTKSSIVIKEGQACRIFTGAPVPDGADTVVMQEKVTLLDNVIHVDVNQLTVGMNVRAKGSEIKSGQAALQKGAYLSPAAIGFLTGIGVAHVKVYRKPRVALIITGNEFQDFRQKLSFGQVYESNSYMLAAALKHEGIEDIQLFKVEDNLSKMVETLALALKSSDLVLLTGGVSVGDYDFVVEATSRCTVKQVFHKVKQKPGKPLFFGAKENKLIFGLPGNPASVLSCYYNYVLSAIHTMVGKDHEATELKATLTTDYQKSPNLTFFLKGSYQNNMVTPLSAQESYRLSSFAQANCLICLEEEKEYFRKGDSVKVLLITT
jgi:molybdopterin molybdotransferase